MEFIAGELRRLADLKAAKHITDEEFEALRLKVVNGTLAAPSSTEKDLAEHFASEALRKHQSWRVQYEDFLLQENSYKEEDLGGKKDTFLSLAKANSVTPMERMLASYSLYATNADAAFFRSLVANVPDDKRVEYHNWYVARACGEAFLSQHGAEIAAGAPPLFGPQKEFGALNVALLKQAGREVFGSGPRNRSCFDQAEPPAQESRMVFAAGYAIPVDNGFVDVGIVEDAINWMDVRVKDLEAAMATAQLQAPPPQRPKPAQGKPKSQGYGNQGYGNQGYGNQGYANQGYNQGRGRGGRGGRGGGRSRGYGYQGNY